MRCFLLLTISLLAFLTIKSQELSGRIVKVSDGDTVILLDSTNTQYKIRLWGIDCPEKGQDYGNRATQHTKQLCANKYVTVEVKGLDMYKRTLGVIYVGDINVNEDLLVNGYAWMYRYTKNKHYQQLEDKARDSKINIWSMKDPIEPYLWRKQQNKKKATK